jgi:Tol biopolymer transport system component
VSTPARGRVAAVSRARVAIFSSVAIAGLAAALVVLAALHLTGCARKSGASAEIHETRLTTDGVGKYMLRFSPDGRWIAYSARAHGEPAWGVYVVPREGGQPRRISPDSVGMLGVDWTADSKGLYCAATEGGKICRVALDRSLEVVDTHDAITRFSAISADGKTELLLRFNRDNRDLGVKVSGGEFKYVAATPQWEEDAIFGPGPGEITVVSRPSYQAPVSTIAIWSPKAAKFSPLPLAEGQNTQPAWSADGRYLAYVVTQNGQSDVWAYDAKSARTLPLIAGPGDVVYPSWSPDGAWLAVCRSASTSHIFSGDPRKGAARPLTQGPARDNSPMVSPDGKWVAFMRSAGPGGGGRPTPSLCVVPEGGGPVSELDLQGVRLAGKGIETLAWSGDCRQIAFQGLNSAGKMDIYRIGRDGSGLARVTVEPGADLEPRWSPDGRWISYTRAGGGKLEVAVVPANGGLSRTLSPPEAKSEGALWGPDSEHLLYVSYGKRSSFQIWVTSLSHPERKRMLLDESGMVWPVYWSRDGREILLARTAGSHWYYAARSIDTGEESRIGEVVMVTASGVEMVDLNARGQHYRDLIYPNGAHVYADGQDNADIYRVRVRELLGSRLLAAGGR